METNNSSKGLPTYACSAVTFSSFAESIQKGLPLVCHIYCKATTPNADPTPKGVGFLVGKDLLMTNHHVLPSPTEAQSCVAIFISMQSPSPETRTVTYYTIEFNPDVANKGYFFTGSDFDRNFDYTIVALQHSLTLYEISKHFFGVLSGSVLN